jgi:hypothetical protein
MTSSQREIHRKRRIIEYAERTGSIVWYLERYHGIKTSDATVYRVCKRHGMNRLPNRVGRRAVHTHRHEKQVPGHHVQVDVKFLTLKRKKGAPVRRYQYTAIDDATRVRALKIYRRHTQARSRRRGRRS